MVKRISRMMVLYCMSLTLILSAALQQGVAAQSGDIGVTFVRDTHTVTFMMNDGSNVNHAVVNNVYSGMSINASTNALMPPDPIRNGFTFTGWNTQPSNLGSVFTVNTVVNGNITVFARWTENLPNTHIVTFRMNDGSSINHAIIPNIVSGGTVGAQMPTTPVRNGFVFAGWNIQANGSGAPFTASTQVTGNINVFAQWIQLFHTVQFVDWNGWPISTQQVPHGSSAVAPANPYRSGHIFTGWNRLFDSVTDDMTIIAVYQIIIGGATPTPNPTPLVTPTPTLLVTPTPTPYPTPTEYPPPDNEEIEPEPTPVVTEPEPTPTPHVPITPEPTPSIIINPTPPAQDTVIPPSLPGTGDIEPPGIYEPEPIDVTVPDDPVRYDPPEEIDPRDEEEEPTVIIEEPIEDEPEQPVQNNETGGEPPATGRPANNVPGSSSQSPQEDPVFLNTNTPPRSFANVPSLSFGDRGVLLFAPMGVQAWSLISLLLCILGFILFVAVAAHALIKKKREEDEIINIKSPDDIVGILTELEGKPHKHYKVLWLAVMGIMGMLSVFLFVLTQDLDRMMVLFDLSTFAHAFIFAIGVLAAVLIYRRTTVKFETNGGSKVPKQKVESGNLLLAPDSPSRQGYVFAGWYSDDTLFNAWNYNTKVEKSFKLYARWIVDEKPFHRG